MPARRKKRRKNRGGDITPMRHRRSLFFVAPATPAGRPSRRKPGETVQALPGRPGRAGCDLPGAPSCPRLPRPRRVRAVEPSCTGCAGAAGGRASAQAHRWRVLVANHVSEGPPGSPQPPPSHCFSAHDCAALWGIVRTSAVWGGSLVAPEPVSAHRPPFSVGLTTSAVSGSSRRPPGSFRCG